MARSVTTFRSTFVFAAAVALSAPSAAFGPQGHEVVGALADTLLRPGTAAQVRQILGMPLRSAATWADCVKDVMPVAGKGLLYRPDPKYHASCQQFESTAGIARMQDYVKRNWSQCTTAPHAQDCHKLYHFADVAVLHDKYDRSYAGTSDHDIVSAIGAAVDVLQGRPAPHPIDIKDKKEALLLLAHLVGDLHQPLHVGSVYLDRANHPTDPGADGTPLDKAMDTHGGNSLEDGSTNLHAEWDEVPRALNPAALPPSLVAGARAAAPSAGDVKTWPAAWASATVVSASAAFKGVAFVHAGAAKPGDWVVKFADRPGYAAQRIALQTREVALAGAHLAELLNTLLP